MSINSGKGQSEIVETETKKVAEEFHFWQALLIAENNEDWVRTYALQVRDKLGEYRARDALENLFNNENKELKQEETTDKMIHIPAGKFLFGSYQYSDEWPVRWVDLDEYKIDTYPVTNEEFIEFLRDHKKLNDDEENEIIYFELSKIKASEDGLFEIAEKYKGHPVTAVTWYGATEYCKWRSKKAGITYRLPTEEEWEKAARCFNGRRYPWGNEFDKNKCNTYESGIRGTTPVDKYPDGVSLYGCYDMAGNVLEWTSSEYEGAKALRGGSWNFNHKGARCAYRLRYALYDRFVGIGFRCARTITL